MKKVVLGLVLGLILALALASTAVAAGPGNNGYGASPTGEQPPNEVYVPATAYEARGGELPPNLDSNGALFYLPGGPK